MHLWFFEGLHSTTMIKMWISTTWFTFEGANILFRKIFQIISEQSLRWQCVCWHNSMSFVLIYGASFPSDPQYFASLSSAHQWYGFQQCILLKDDGTSAILNRHLWEGSYRWLELMEASKGRSGVLCLHFSAAEWMLSNRSRQTMLIGCGWIQHKLTELMKLCGQNLNFLTPVTGFL